MDFTDSDMHLKAVGKHCILSAVFVTDDEMPTFSTLTCAGMCEDAL